MNVKQDLFILHIIFQRAPQKVTLAAWFNENTNSMFSQTLVKCSVYRYHLCNHSYLTLIILEYVNQRKCWHLP